MKRIHIRTNFLTQRERADYVYLDSGRDTLMHCLAQTEESAGIQIIDRGLMDIYPDIEIALNDIDFYFLSEKFDTRMNEGDILSISMVTMGGG